MTSILDAREELLSLFPKKTYCIPLNNNKTPIVKFDEKKWGIKPEIIDAQIVDTTIAYAVRCKDVICVDVDLYNDGAGDIPQKFRKTLTQLTGSQNGKHYIYLIDERMKDWISQTKITNLKLDIKIGINSLFVGNGSISKKGKYTIIEKMPPQQMPQELFEFIDNSMPNKIVLKDVACEDDFDLPNEIYERSSFKKLKKISKLISVKRFTNTNDWVKFLFALQFETNGSQEGFELFCNLSRKGKGYENTSNEVYKKYWNNCNKTNTKQITIGTLYDWVKEDTPNIYWKEIKKIYKDFNIQYFHRLKDTSKQEEINELTIKLPTLNSASQKELRQQIRELKKIQEKKSIKMRKKYYELFHFKVNNPTIYVRKSREDEYQEMTRKQFSDYAENQRLNENSWSALWCMEESIRTYEKMDFLPTGCDDNKNGVFNVYRGMRIERIEVKKNNKSFKPILEQIRALTGYEEECYDYLLKYLAQLVQQPGVKSECALIFANEQQGVGKNVFFELLFKGLLGDTLILQTDNQNDIFGQFPLLHEKLVAIIDETQAKDSFANTERIKNYITARTINKNKKNKAKRIIRDFTRFIFFSNNQTPVNIAVEDRRFCVFRPSTKYVKNQVYFDKLVKTLKDDECLKNFYNYLMSIDISHFRPQLDRPITEAYKDIQSVNIPRMARWLEQFCIENDNNLDTQININLNDYDTKKGNGEDIVGYKNIIKMYSKKSLSSSRLFELYTEFLKENNYDKVPSKTQFGRNLKKYIPDKKRTRNGIQYTIYYEELKKLLIKKQYVDNFEYEDYFYNKPTPIFEIRHQTKMKDILKEIKKSV